MSTFKCSSEEKVVREGDEEETSEEDRVEESDEDEDIEDEEEEEEGMEYPVLYTICEALSDFAGEEKGDLSFKKGDHFTVLSTRDDGWWEVVSEEGKKGLVPSTYVKVIQRARNFSEGALDAKDRENSENRGSQVWKNIKDTMKKTSIPDVLTLLGAMPLGFRPSSLAALMSEDNKYSISSFVTPKLGKSGLTFTDIQWSPQTNQLQPVSVHIQKIITLLAFRQIPLPGVGVDVTTRHVRVCLHDGVKVLSNVHTIEAKYDAKIPKQWTFATKIAVSVAEDSSMFVRTKSCSATIGILFQPCISYSRVSTGEKGEMSCGWVFMRLLDDSGISVANRTKVLRVHGENPFEQLDSTFTQSKSGSLKSLIAKKRCAHFVVRIRSPTSDQRQQLELIPDTLIGPLSILPHLVLYRQLLADSLLRDRLAADSTSLIYSPLLATFPSLLKQPDILDVLMNEWSKKMKIQKRSFKKDSSKLKELYVQLYMETAYPIMNLASLPQYQLSDPDVKQARQNEIRRLMQLRQEKDPIITMLSSSVAYRPFRTKELALDIVGTHCFPLSHS